MIVCVCVQLCVSVGRGCLYVSGCDACVVLCSVWVIQVCGVGREGRADYGSISLIVWCVCMYDVCACMIVCAAMCHCGEGMSVCEWV